jgi:hypothetical protein
MAEEMKIAALTQVAAKAKDEIQTITPP